MRTVYLGTTDFAAGVLERLVSSDHRPALVITRPDRPRGRGRRIGSPPVADTARRLGLELLQPPSVNTSEARAGIAAVDPQTACICAFGALIKEPLLSAYAWLNVHPSLLPRWRGAAPIERAIEAGDELTGVSIMRPVEELDAGPVCLAGHESIGPEDDYGSLSDRLRRLAGELLVETLDTSPPFVDQPAAGVTFAPKIEPRDRVLDSQSEAAAVLERRIRALTPHIGAYVELAGGERLGVRRSRVLATDTALEIGVPVADGERLILPCAKGMLELIEVQPAGARSMPAADYLRGRGRRLLAGA